MRTFAPDLRTFLLNLDALTRASVRGLPALRGVINGLRPLLGSIGPFTQEFNPILRYLPGTRVAPKSSRVPTTPGGVPAAATPSRSTEGALAGQVQPGAGPASGRTLAAVRVDRITFMPEVIHIHPGDAVRFTNHDEVVHTVTADENLNSSQVGPFASPRLAPRRSWTARFSQPGTYPYVCTIHPTMVGQVVVG